MHVYILICYWCKLNIAHMACPMDMRTCSQLTVTSSTIGQATLNGLYACKSTVRNLECVCAVYDWTLTEGLLMVGACKPMGTRGPSSPSHLPIKSVQWSCAKICRYVWIRVSSFYLLLRPFSPIYIFIIITSHVNATKKLLGFKKEMASEYAKWQNKAEMVETVVVKQG